MVSKCIHFLYKNYRPKNSKKFKNFVKETILRSIPIEIMLIFINM